MPLKRLPEARYSQDELLNVLTAGIAQNPNLSDQSKIVLIRGFLNDWDDGVLATALGTTRSNVHTIRSRDLGHLRDDTSYMGLLEDYLKG